MARIKAIFDLHDRMSRKLGLITGNAELLRKRTERPMTIGVSDRASKALQRISKYASSNIARPHQMVIEAKDRATNRVLRPLAGFLERRLPRVHSFTISAVDRALPVMERIRRMGHNVFTRGYIITMNAKDKATSIINRVTQLAKASFHRGYTLSVRAIDLASNTLRNISNFARNNLNRTYTVTVKALDLATKPLRAVANMATSTAGLLGGAAGVYGGVVKPLGMVMDRQSTTTAFEVLLGSAEAAYERIDELTGFAGRTPFARDEIYKSSRLLETFTGSALSTGAGLELVGDVATGTQHGLEETAMWFGRLYDGMKSGRPIGDATSRLQEMGAISGEARARLEGLAESGRDISEIWPEATKEFSRYNGMMLKMSDNLQNLLLGTKQFFVQNMFMRWGEGLASALTPALSAFRDWRGENAATVRAMGNQFEQLGERAAKAFLRPAASIGSFLGDQMKILFPVDDNMRNLATGEIHDPELKQYVESMDKQGFKARLDIVVDNTKDVFGEWWNQTGQPGLNRLVGNAGSVYGGFINNVISAAFGLESESTGSAFADAGMAAGRSFAENFIDAFQPWDMAKKMAGKWKEVNWDFVASPSGESFGKAFVANAIAAIVLSKIATTLLPLGKLAGGLVKGGKWLGKQTVGRAWGAFKTHRDNKNNKPPTTGGGMRPRSETHRQSRIPKWMRAFSNNGFVGGGLGVAGKFFRPLGLGTDLFNIAGAEGQERDELIGGSVGGLSGMLAGGAAGAALGSVVPGLGTAVGGLVGSIVGGLGGEKLGKMLANSGVLESIKSTIFNQGWWSEQWQGVTTWASESWSNATATWDQVKESISSTLFNGDWWGEKWADTTRWMSEKWASATETWESIKSTISSTLFSGDWWAEQAGFVFGVLEGTLFSGEWWGEKWTQVTDWAKEKWDGSIWQEFMQLTSETLFSGDWWNGKWEEVKGWASTKWASAVEIWESTKESIGMTLFSGDWWNSQWDSVKGWAQSQWDGAVVIWESVKTNIGESIFNAGWWGEKWDGVKGWAQSKWDTFTSVWTSARESISSTLFSSEWWNGKWESVKGWAASALASIGSSISSTMSSFTSGRSRGNETAQKYARGGYINRPHLGLVGEAGPEMIIPLSGHRNRAISLWERTGQMLGMSSPSGAAETVKLSNSQSHAAQSAGTNYNDSSKTTGDIHLHISGDHYHNGNEDDDTFGKKVVAAVKKALSDEDFEGGDVVVG